MEKEYKGFDRDSFEKAGEEDILLEEINDIPSQKMNKFISLQPDEIEFGGATKNESNEFF